MLFAVLWTWWFGSAQAHTGALPTRGVEDWSHLPDLEPGAWVVWEFYPSIVIGCLAFLALYAALSGPLRTRWSLSETGPTASQASLFVTSIAVVFFSLQGPLHELSDLYLFSGHMVQHLLITLVFPPLFILGIPAWMWQPLVRHEWAAAIGRAITAPLPAFLIWTFSLTLWHVPAFYDAALADHNIHIAEHLIFMSGAVVMWWPALSPIEEVPRLSPGASLVYLFLSTIPMKLLGAIITVSDFVLYRFYATQPRVFGLDPLADQRLGGVIMWMPGGLIIWFAMGAIFFTSFYAEFAAQRQRGSRRAVARPASEGAPVVEGAVEGSA